MMKASIVGGLVGALGLVLGGCATGRIGGEQAAPGDTAPAAPGEAGSGGQPWEPSTNGGESGEESTGVTSTGGAPGEVDPEGFVSIPPGTFTMGSPASEPGHVWWNGIDVEKQHQVTLTRGIWMSETEVTQAQWLAVTGYNPSVFAACGGDCPVENVTWFEIVAFSNLLSQQQGLAVCYFDPSDGTPYQLDDAAGWRVPDWPKGYACLGVRLPTEAEWEYAARAGTSTAHYLGDATHENVAKASWYGQNSQCSYSGCEDDNCRSGAGGIPPSGPHPVGQKIPNAWGLYDTTGNVWEFVWDVFGEYHDGQVTDPVGAMANVQGYRVARGGSWLNQPGELRMAARDGNDCTCDPDNGPGSHTGFRIVRTRPQ